MPYKHNPLNGLAHVFYYKTLLFISSKEFKKTLNLSDFGFSQPTITLKSFDVASHADVPRLRTNWYPMLRDLCGVTVTASTCCLSDMVFDTYVFDTTDIGCLTKVDPGGFSKEDNGISLWYANGTQASPCTDVSFYSHDWCHWLCPYLHSLIIESK